MSEPAAAAPFVWEASAAWQAIDFISDLHLSADHPATVRAWSAYLTGTSADAVCVLGDLFEAWVGDDARLLPFERSLVDTLAQAAARRPIAFMRGNRDFLVGDELLAAAGLGELPDPCCLDAFGSRWLLCHGDAQCLDDLDYQRFRAMVRSRAWQQAFLARPIAERMAIAREMRRASRNAQRGAVETQGDLDAAECRRLMAGCGATAMIHGHTHRPASHPLGPGLWRHVLGDWDLDDESAPRAEVIRLNRDGTLVRLSPSKASTAG